MVKLWEVLKAFDEGQAERAWRECKGQSVDLHHNKSEKINTLYIDGIESALRDEDFRAEDWYILEKTDRKKFKFLYVIYELSGSQRTTRLKNDDYTDLNLLEAQQLVRKEYPDDIVSVLSAVGVSESGEANILVQEGRMVQ